MGPAPLTLSAPSFPVFHHFTPPAIPDQCCSPWPLYSGHVTLREVLPAHGPVRALSVPPALGCELQQGWTCLLSSCSIPGLALSLRG